MMEPKSITSLPCPTCIGATRETVGMVCQTCGTDYRPPDVIAYERGYNDGVEQERAAIAKTLGRLRSDREVLAFAHGYIRAYRLTQGGDEA